MSSIQIDRLLDTVIKLKASDLHMTVGRKPTLRLHGGLKNLDTKVLDSDDVSSLRDCFGWLVRFRWRMRAAAFLDGRRVSDVVALSELAPQERAVLRNVAREVAGISRKLNYLAATSAFR